LEPLVRIKAISMRRTDLLQLHMPWKTPGWRPDPLHGDPAGRSRAGVQVKDITSLWAFPSGTP